MHRQPSTHHSDQQSSDLMAGGSAAAARSSPCLARGARGQSASALIQAPPQALYAIIADYEHGHPRILPRPPFVSLAVE